MARTRKNAVLAALDNVAVAAAAIVQQNVEAYPSPAVEPVVLAPEEMAINGALDEHFPDPAEIPMGTKAEIDPQLTAAPEPEILTTEEVEAIAEATSGQAVAVLEDQATGTEAATTEEVPAEPAVKLVDALAAITEETVDATVHLAAAQMDARAAFELEKSPDNENIQKTLKKARAQMVTKRAARLMAVAQMDVGQLNREIHGGSRYNVYAIGKLADIIYAVTDDGAVKNAINIAVMKSLFKFRAAGVPFTGDMARAAASDKIRVEAALRQHLVRHTVSASTAPTQASSTMQALQTIGVVRSEGSSRNPTYHLVEGPITVKLEEMLMAAAA